MMARKPSQQHRKAPLERVRAGRSDDAPFDLSLGPTARTYHGAAWPDLQARALAEWNRSRDALMAEPGRRPWAYFWFDVPHAETFPGPTRDANLAAGRLTAEEAAYMGWAHAQHAFGRIAESRPGQTTADWLADPALIEKSLALCGWNVFTPDVIAHLRAREQERQAGRRIGRQKEEVPE
jgi:hypothetical protein